MARHDLEDLQKQRHWAKYGRCSASQEFAQAKILRRSPKHFRKIPPANLRMLVLDGEKAHKAPFLFGKDRVLSGGPSQRSQNLAKPSER